jgi:hypothetical protein
MRKVVRWFDTALLVPENDLKRIQLALGFVWSRNPCLLLAFYYRRNMSGRGLAMLLTHFSLSLSSGFGFRFSICVLGSQFLLQCRLQAKQGKHLNKCNWQPPEKSKSGYFR